MSNLKQGINQRLAVLNYAIPILEGKIEDVMARVEILRKEQSHLEVLNSEIYSMDEPEPVEGTDPKSEEVIDRLMQALKLILDPEHEEIVIAAITARHQKVDSSGVDELKKRREVKERGERDPQKPYMKPSGRADNVGLTKLVEEYLRACNEPITTRQVANWLQQCHPYLGAESGGPWSSWMKSAANILSLIHGLKKHESGKERRWSLA